MQDLNHVDAVVIGGGHASSTACDILNRMNFKVLMIVPSLKVVSKISCSSNFGAPGRSHALFELGQFSQLALSSAEKTLYYIDIINQSKGPAMHSHQFTVDKELYRKTVLSSLQKMENVSIIEDTVEDIVIENNKATGVVTKSGITIKSRAVIIGAGTFLNGKLHRGLETSAGGRVGEAPSIGLAQRLKEIGLPMGRLKTGTPPRIDGKTIDFSKMKEKWGMGAHDENARPTISFGGNANMHQKQMPVWHTETNEVTHAIMREGFDRSPFILQHFEGEGPGYCPSIEDKITRFTDKNSHSLRLQAETLSGESYYLAGANSSLPNDIMQRAVNSIKGLEHAVISQPAYAVEYDCFNIHSFKKTLEFKDIENLYACSSFWTSGTSESLALGTVAATQCGLKLQGKEPWKLERHHGYLGVMLDDLFTKELHSAYRFLTASNEYRLLHSQHSSEARFLPVAKEFGLVSDERWDHFCRKQDAIAHLQEKYKLTWLNSKNLPQEEATQYIGSPLSHETNLASLIKRPEMSYEKIAAMPSVQAIAPELSKSVIAETHGEKLAGEIVEQVEISFKYEGYINRQQEEVKRMSAQNNIKLPIDFDYATITALSTEVKQKLNQFKPETIGQASRISGVTPSAIGLLLIWLKKNKMLNIQTM
jgi:tRNA uridine 5-carboxymethylaminomethyl modification enzyme